MNRTEYMRELDALLHGISKEEREEAINHLSEEDREALELGRKMLKAGIGQNDPEECSITMIILMTPEARMKKK